MFQDPYQHAEKLGIPITYAHPPNNLKGLYTGHEIILTPHQTTRSERCTLAHELGHAHYDQPLIHQNMSKKAEHKADLYAAEMLICPQQLHHYMKYLTPTEAVQELQVTTWCLQTWVKKHHKHT